MGLTVEHFSLLAAFTEEAERYDATVSLRGEQIVVTFKTRAGDEALGRARIVEDARQIASEMHAQGLIGPLSCEFHAHVVGASLQALPAGEEISVDVADGLSLHFKKGVSPETDPDFALADDDFTLVYSLEAET